MLHSESRPASNNRGEPEITVVSGSGLRRDCRLTLEFVCPPTKFFGGNGTNVVFETGCSYWTTNTYLFCLRMCLCVFEVGLAFSVKPSASRQTISSHPDKRRRLISSQPLWKASVHLQPVQERCGVNNAQQGHGGITQPPNSVSQCWSATAVENWLSNAAEPQTVPPLQLAVLCVRNTNCAPELWNNEIITCSFWINK